MSAGWVDPNADYAIIRRFLMMETQRGREQQIDTIRADVQVTLAVAEFVLGWTNPRIAFYDDSFRPTTMTADFPMTFGLPGGRGNIPDFVRDVRAAFETVLPRMQRQLAFNFTLERRAPYVTVTGGTSDRDDVWLATFDQAADGMVSAQDREVVRAICKAALKAAMRWKERRPEQWRPSPAPEIRIV